MATGPKTEEVDEDDPAPRTLHRYQHIDLPAPAIPPEQPDPLPEFANLQVAPLEDPNVRLTFNIPASLLANSQFSITLTPRGSRYLTSLNDNGPVPTTSIRAPVLVVPEPAQGAPTHEVVASPTPPPTPRRSLRPQNQSMEQYRQWMEDVGDPIYPPAGAVPNDTPLFPIHPRKFWVVLKGLKIGVFYAQWTQIDRISKRVGGHWRLADNLVHAQDLWDSLQDETRVLAIS